jgi:hypothetical protein
MISAQQTSTLLLAAHTYYISIDLIPEAQCKLRITLLLLELNYYV